MSKLVVDNDNITPVARLGKHTLAPIAYTFVGVSINWIVTFSMP